jgi:hypothetical protein
MAGPVFHHNAVACQFDNVELNQAHRGPVLIFDQGGGEYVIGTFGLEQGTYAATTTLVDVTNGSLQARFFYLTVTVNADISVFEVGNSRRSFVKIEHAHLDPRFGRVGTFRLVRSRAVNLGPDDPHRGFVEIGSFFDETRLDRRFSLFDPNDHAAAALITIRTWSDPSRVMFGADCDLMLRAYSPATIVFAAAASADRSVMLPEDGNTFTGRSFEISKARHTTSARLWIRTHDGCPLASIPAGRNGRVRVLYDHSRRGVDGQGWLVVGRETWS